MRQVNGGLEHSLTSRLLHHRPLGSSSEAEGATPDELCHLAQPLPSES